jgi:hypothetical protein
VVRLPGHTSYVWSLAFSPDGATLASGSGDSTVLLWDTSPLETRYQAHREAEALGPEAERMVAMLLREQNDSARIVDALRANGALSEPLRQAALRAVLRMAQPPETAPDNPPRRRTMIDGGEKVERGSRAGAWSASRRQKIVRDDANRRRRIEGLEQAIVRYGWDLLW